MWDKTMNLFKLHARPQELEAWNRPYIEARRELTNEIEQEDDEGNIELIPVHSNVMYRMRNGVEHSTTHPITIQRNGEEEWKVDGKRHRDGGPALVGFAPGGVKWEFWYKHGAQHRDDGPAVVATRKDGTIGAQQWWRNGIRYNENGSVY